MGNVSTSNDEYFERATKRAKLFGCYSVFDVIVFLEKQIEEYRNKTDTLTKIIDNTARKTTQVEAVQGNTINDIIKALSENGYNMISVNAYKNTESEE